MINSMLRYAILSMLMTFCICAFVFSQSRLLPIPDTTVTAFDVDPLGAVYLKAGNTLQKIDQDGAVAGVYNEVKKYGELEDVIAENPWKVILFYKNFASVVLLDKYFKETATINFRKKNVYAISAVTTSQDNMLWVFDDEEKRLKKTDESGNMQMQTEDFRILFPRVPAPIKLLDRDGFIYLYDPHNGLYIFDYYGNYKSHQPYTGWRDFTVIKGIIYACDGQKFLAINSRLLEEEAFPLPFALQPQDLLTIKNNKIYVLKNNGLTEYSFEMLMKNKPIDR